MCVESLTDRPSRRFARYGKGGVNEGKCGWGEEAEKDRVAPPTGEPTQPARTAGQIVIVTDSSTRIQLNCVDHFLNDIALAISRCKTEARKYLPKESRERFRVIVFEARITD